MNDNDNNNDMPFTEADILAMEMAESSDGKVLRFTVYCRNPEYVDPETIESELQDIINQARGE